MHTNTHAERACTTRFQQSASTPYGCSLRKLSSGCRRSTLASAVLGVGVPAHRGRHTAQAERACRQTPAARRRCPRACPVADRPTAPLEQQHAGGRARTRHDPALARMKHCGHPQLVRHGGAADRVPLVQDDALPVHLRGPPIEEGWGWRSGGERVSCTIVRDHGAVEARRGGTQRAQQAQQAQRPRRRRACMRGLHSMGRCAFHSALSVSKVVSTCGGGRKGGRRSTAQRKRWALLSCEPPFRTAAWH